jgi:glyoxylase-like metal-dependent hydrolase (beta-lactamase superfamily II)
VILETAAAPPFMKNGFVVGCETTRQAIVIDPGDEVDDLLAFITREKLTPAAILLTHAHVDHFGSAIWFAKTHGTPVYCHAEEVGHSKREYLEQASPVDVAKRIWQPRYLAWTVAITRKGALTHEGIGSTAALTEDVAAGLPGTPMAIPTPGHTGGHCSFVVDGVLVSGDALVTGHPLLSREGPQLLPTLFNHDQDGCVRSLAALGLLDTEVLLPGHGPVWRGSIREAARQASEL